MADVRANMAAITKPRVNQGYIHLENQRGY